MRLWVIVKVNMNNFAILIPPPFKNWGCWIWLCHFRKVIFPHENTKILSHGSVKCLLQIILRTVPFTSRFVSHLQSYSIISRRLSLFYIILNCIFLFINLCCFMVGTSYSPSQTLCWHCPEMVTKHWPNYWSTSTTFKFPQQAITKGAPPGLTWGVPGSSSM